MTNAPTALQLKLASQLTVAPQQPRGLAVPAPGRAGQAQRQHGQRQRQLVHLPGLVAVEARRDVDHAGTRVFTSVRA